MGFRSKLSQRASILDFRDECSDGIGDGDTAGCSSKLPGTFNKDLSIIVEKVGETTRLKTVKEIIDDEILKSFKPIPGYVVLSIEVSDANIFKPQVFESCPIQYVAEAVFSDSGLFENETVQSGSCTTMSQQLKLVECLD